MRDHQSNVVLVMDNIKYIENLGGVIRAAACFEIAKVLWSGTRVKLDSGRHNSTKLRKTSAGHAKPSKRVPREFRHNDYKQVEYFNTERPFDFIHIAGVTTVPVCVEICDGAEDLTWFVHPANAVYVFGPEDGSVSQIFKRLCHKFVKIPTKYCLNVAAAVNVVLADRIMKEQRNV